MRLPNVSTQGTLLLKYDMQKKAISPSFEISPELQFLIVCCRTETSAEDKTFINDFLAEKDVDKESLLTLSGVHGVIPLVYKTLKKLSDDGAITVNEEILASFKDAYTQIARRNMLMSAELLRIMKLMENNGIEALAFKGPALAQQVYGDITLRQFGDLDILVNPKNASQAAKVLIDHNYTAPLPLSILDNTVCLEAAKDFSLFNEKSNIHIELHWRLFEKKYNLNLLNTNAAASMQTISLNGYAIPSLSQEPLLVYLCLHGAKHGFERLEWVCDIDRMIRAVSVKWELCISIAETTHALRTFYLGLDLAHQYMQTDLPDDIIKRINIPAVKALHRINVNRWSSSIRNKSEMEKNWETYRYQAKLFDSKFYFFRFYIAILFKISTTDCQTFTLPAQLKFLYVFLRPFRMTWKYGKHLLTRK